MGLPLAARLLYFPLWPLPDPLESPSPLLGVVRHHLLSFPSDSVLRVLPVLSNPALLPYLSLACLLSFCSSPLVAASHQSVIPCLTFCSSHLPPPPPSLLLPLSSACEGFLLGRGYPPPSFLLYAMGARCRSGSPQPYFLMTARR